MVDWQVTATTIRCDVVDDDVTIIVYRDWRTRCTGYEKYGENPDKKTARMLKKKAEGLGGHLSCHGPRDCGATVYRDRLVAEDKGVLTSSDS